MILIIYRAISATLAVLFTVVSSVSCSHETEAAYVTSQAPNIPIASSRTSNNKVLSILQPRSEISRALQQAADQYSAANGNPLISVHTIANPHDYAVALRARLLSGERVDLFQLRTPAELRMVGGNADDLSDLEWLKAAAPSTLDTVTIGDGIYGVPYSIEGAGLIVNLGIFRTAGVYFGSRLTLESLEEVFQELHEMLANGELGEALPELEAVTELAAMDTGYLATYIADLFLAESFESAADAYASSSLDPIRNESMRDFIRLIARYSSSETWANLNNVTLHQQLEAGIGSGRVAAVYGDTEVYRRILAANPETAANLALMPVPIGTDEEPRAAVFTGAASYWCIYSQSAPEIKAEARSFLTWLYNSEKGAKIYADTFTALSPFPDTSKETANPFHAQLIRMIEAGSYLPMLHTGAPDGWGSGVFAHGLRRYLGREVTWEGFTEECMVGWKDAHAAEPF